MQEEKKRLTLLIDYEVFEKFKKLAREQTRTPGNLGRNLSTTMSKKTKRNNTIEITYKK